MTLSPSAGDTGGALPDGIPTVTAPTVDHREGCVATCGSPRAIAMPVAGLFDTFFACRTRGSRPAQARRDLGVQVTRRRRLPSLLPASAPACDIPRLYTGRRPAFFEDTQRASPRMGRSRKDVYENSGRKLAGPAFLHCTEGEVSIGL